MKTNTPEHYQLGGKMKGVEAWDVFCAIASPEQIEGAYLFNVLTYVLRCQKKGSKLSDLKKAQDYLETWIEELEEIENV